MNLKLIVGAVSMVSLSVVFGCASSSRQIATPVGRSTTTGAVVCPQGYVPSVDGERCVTPEETPADYTFQPPP